MELAVTTLSLEGYAVALWLHTAIDPPKDEWDRGLDTLIAATRAVRTAKMRHLVITDGGAPNAAQRARMHNELARSEPLRLAVVTTVLSNPIKRGVATALSWANPQIGFFQPPQIEQALQHVDLTGHADVLWSEFVKMQREIPPVAALRAVALALGVDPPVAP